MHNSVMEFVRRSIGEKDVKNKRVLEVGSYDVNGSVRPIITAFGPTEYIGVDFRLGPGVDLVANASSLRKDLGEEVVREGFDLVISTEMLEHVEDWRTAIEEMKAVLKPDGILLLTTRSNGFPLHGYPYDYWRFSQEDMSRVFSDAFAITVEDDDQDPGVFVKAHKLDKDRPADLNFKVYSMSTTRNLIYNCCALEHTDEWRDNVAKLNQYAHVFNGRRIVIVRQGEGIAPAEEIKKAFSFRAEFIELPNDPQLQEVAGLLDVIRSLASLDPKEFTFYAHTKGVRYESNDPKLPSIRLWRDTMYEQCLSDVRKIDAALQKYACCGCFKQKAPDDDLWGEWTFAGTFWWVNHDKLFSSNWEDLPESPYGIEAYLGRIFDTEDALCLYEQPGRGNLYSLAKMRPRKDPTPVVVAATKAPPTPPPKPHPGTSMQHLVDRRRNRLKKHV